MESFDLASWPLFKSQHAPSVSIDCVSIDSRSISSPNTLFIALKGSRDDGHHYVKSALDAGACFAIVNENWTIPSDVDPKKLIRVPCCLYALQDLAKKYRQSLSLCLIAVVGSCGKTMLKDLLGHLFGTKAYTSPESYNSQLGVPLGLLSIPKKSTLAFIEMAATESGEMERLVSMAQPDIALVTNFYNRSFSTEKAGQTVVQEILELLCLLPLSGFALVEDHPHVDLSCLQVPWYAWNKKSENLPWIESIANDGQERNLCCTFPDNKKTTISLPTEHAYLQNLLILGVQAAWKLGLSSSTTSQALSSYIPDLMRTEVWKNKKGTTFINSTYCHTPLTLDASLSEITKGKGKRALVIGGNAEFSKHAKEIVTCANRHDISTLFAWPQSFAQTLQKQTHEPLSILSFERKEKAVTAAQESAREDDTIIFKGTHKLPIKWLLKETEGLPLTTIRINLAAIRTNIERIRLFLPEKTHLMIMVKASAYGTDAVLMADFFYSIGITMLGVSHVDEGEQLRLAGVSQGIFVIHAAEYEMEKVATNNLEIGISTLSQVHAAQRAAQKEGVTIRVHLNVDTGLKRFGCHPSLAYQLAHAIEKAPELELNGIYTHFSSAEDPKKDALTLDQAKTLSTIIDTLSTEGIHPRYRHASNSAAALRLKLPQFNMVRIGLAPFGLLLSPHVKLRPALSLSTRIVSLSTAKKGDLVGYNGTHTVDHDAKLAVIPMGYHDGLHRAYSNTAAVQVRGHLVPIVGKVCMDFAIVDVTSIEDVAVGDTVHIFGEDEHGRYHSPEVFAKSGGTIVNELMASLGPRIKRLFIYDESLTTRAGAQMLV